MILYFQDNKHATFEVEIEDTKTIAELKEKIAQEREIQPNAIKLIFRGKILDNSAIVSTIQNCSSSTRIVFFVHRPTAAQNSSPKKPAEPAPAPAPPQPAPPPPEQPAQPADPVPPLPTQPAPQPSPIPPTFPTPQNPQDPTNPDAWLEALILEGLSKVSITEANVQTLLEFGLTQDRNAAEMALRVSADKVDYASNLLCEYPTVDKLLEYSKQVYKSQTAQSAQVLEIICHNPALFSQALQTGQCVIFDPAQQRQILVSVPPQGLLQYAAQKGYLARTPDGQLVLRTAVQATSPEEQAELETLSKEFYNLPKEQQEVCQRLAQQYQQNVGEVFQIYQACNFDEAATTAVLQGE